MGQASMHNGLDDGKVDMVFTYIFCSFLNLHYSMTTTGELARYLS